jgi:flavin-binding protein dodecin
MNTIKVLELIGTSPRSWEEAAQNAIKEAHETVEKITGLEVVAQTAKVEGGKIAEYRTTVKIAFLVKSKR